jgi:hypothetical protein
MAAAQIEPQRKGSAAMETKKHGATPAPKDLYSAYYDEFGFYSPMPLSLPARPGPTVEARLPEFTLPDQHGRLVDFHADRGGQKAISVFHRSAYW